MASEWCPAFRYSQGVVAESLRDGTSACQGGRAQGRGQDALDVDKGGPDSLDLSFDNINSSFPPMRANSSVTSALVYVYGIELEIDIVNYCRLRFPVLMSYLTIYYAMSHMRHLHVDP